MFSLAYVILPFSDTPPADAIKASMARFQRGTSGTLPDEWIEFCDDTPEFQELHEAHLTFTLRDGGGMQVEGNNYVSYDIDTSKARAEMQRLGLTRWSVRFADSMSLDEFFDRFGQGSERHAGTGRFGRWLNPVGRWDWWDLGGSFDGVIVGDRRPGNVRTTSKVSSGESAGRAVLSNLQDVLCQALDQEPFDLVDVSNDQNIELVATLLQGIRTEEGTKLPGSIVLPPGALEDHLRWLGTWPKIGPIDTVRLLGLPPDAPWRQIVTSAYERFKDCWAAGVAYHH